MQRILEDSLNSTHRTPVLESSDAPAPCRLPVSPLRADSGAPFSPFRSFFSASLLGLQVLQETSHCKPRELKFVAFVHSEQRFQLSTRTRRLGALNQAMVQHKGVLRTCATQDFMAGPQSIL